MSITLNGTTGIIADNPATVKANAFLDAAGGNTATINGKLPIAIGDVPASASLTLLGTIATTSGSTVTLSGLTLTSYKQLQFVINGVSGTATSISFMNLNGNNVARLYGTAASDVAYGGGNIDLSTGTLFGSSTNSAGYGLSPSFASGLTTASTSISFTTSTGNFDAGTITIYGVK